MRILRPLLPVAMLLVLTVQTTAQELPLLGQGNVPCSSWLERRAEVAGEADTMTAWVLGYLTAFNQYASEPGTDISGGQETEVLIGWIDEYCEKNATAKLHQATAALVEDLRQKAPQ